MTVIFCCTLDVLTQPVFILQAVVQPYSHATHFASEKPSLQVLHLATVAL